MSTRASDNESWAVVTRVRCLVHACRSVTVTAVHAKVCCHESTAIECTATSMEQPALSQATAPGQRLPSPSGRMPTAAVQVLILHWILTGFAGT